MIAGGLGLRADRAAADGEFDPGFPLGVQMHDFSSVFPGATGHVVFNVVRDRVGRWLVAGGAQYSTGAGIEIRGVLARYQPDGAIDTTFGAAGYVTSVPGVAAGRWNPYTIAVLQSGDIAVSTHFGDPVQWLNPDGLFKGAVSLGAGPLLVDQLLTLPDGRMLVVGTEVLSDAGGIRETAAARIVTIGDNSPSTIVRVAGASAPTAHEADAAVDAAGRILLRSCDHIAGNLACALSAYLPDGSVDATFGTAGNVELKVDGAAPGSCAFDVSPDGYIVTACAQLNGGFVRVAMLDPVGRPFAGFAPTTLSTRAGFESTAKVRFEGTGRVLVANGDTDIPLTQWDSVVHAYLPDGSVDTTFGTNGTRFLRSDAMPYGMDVDEQGGVFVYGFTEPSWPQFWIASLVAPDGPALQPPLATTARFVPVNPSRVLDTRDGTGASAGKPAAGATLTLHLAGVIPVPATGVTAVVLNITAADATGPGYVTAWPSAARPIVSNLNLDAVGQTAANLAVVPLGGDGSITLFTQSGAHLIADIDGYFVEADQATAGRYQSATSPFRVLDTRAGLGAPATKPARDGQLALQVAGVGPVPARGASAVVLNVTGTDATADGFITAWPGGTRPLASSLNLERGGTRANLVIVPVGADGTISLFTQSGAHLVADVAGWFTDNTAQEASSGLFVAIPPRRMLDTRITPGLVPADGAVSRAIGGTTVVPPGLASAIVANVTATGALAPGYVTAMPAGQPLPVASNLNVPNAGATVANMAIVGLGGEAMTLYSQTGTHLIVDVTGWFVE